MSIIGSPSTGRMTGNSNAWTSTIGWPSRAAIPAATFWMPSPLLRDTHELVRFNLHSSAAWAHLDPEGPLAEKNQQDSFTKTSY